MVPLSIQLTDPIHPIDSIRSTCRFISLSDSTFQFSHPSDSIELCNSTQLSDSTQLIRFNQSDSNFPIRFTERIQVAHRFNFPFGSSIRLGSGECSIQSFDSVTHPIRINLPIRSPIRVNSTYRLNLPTQSPNHFNSTHRLDHHAIKFNSPIRFNRLNLPKLDFVRFGYCNPS